MLSALTLYAFMSFVLFYPIEAIDEFFQVRRHPIRRSLCVLVKHLGVYLFPNLKYL